MSESGDRAREHPERRFAAPALRYDLNDVAEQLEVASGEQAGGRRASPAHVQETLYKGSDTNTGPTTVALFAFEAGAELPQHVARGVVTIQVLQGKIQVAAEGQDHVLHDQQILILAPNVRHDVRALAPSRMLLTVCLENTPAD